LSDKRATPVGEVLKRYLVRSGYADRLAQADVIAEWPVLVGPTVAAVTKPEAVTPDGTLFVRVKTAPWMQELQLMTPEILRKLGRERRIKRIVWRAQ
jgi:predicted nucleic acid-binding Zn ribbon protein